MSVMWRAEGQPEWQSIMRYFWCPPCADYHGETDYEFTPHWRLYYPMMDFCKPIRERLYEDVIRHERGRAR
jgi:hypothetical protein